MLYFKSGVTTTSWAEGKRIRLNSDKITSNALLVKPELEPSCRFLMPVDHLTSQVSRSNKCFHCTGGWTVGPSLKWLIYEFYTHKLEVAVTAKKKKMYSECKWCRWALSDGWARKGEERIQTCSWQICILTNRCSGGFRKCREYVYEESVRKWSWIFKSAFKVQ